MEEQSQHGHPAGPELKYPEHTPVNLPNSTTILVLGILSIVFGCWYFSIAGVVLGIIALVLSNRDLALYATDKEKYTLSSYNNLRAGRTCSIIGIVVGSIVFLVLILFILGFLATLPFWGMIE